MTVYEDATVAVVVTAYREEAFVGRVIETVPPFVDRIYAVDDASPDGCWGVIQDRAATINRSSDPRTVVPIRHEENRGYGAAVKTGYRRAVADGVDVVAVMNGDGQMDPAILHRIVHPVASGDADYAKGNRLLSSDDHTQMSRFRFLGNVVLSGLSKFATGYWQVSDPQNGYTAISADAIDRIDLERTTDEYGFLNDILVELNLAECHVADVPMRARYGDEESSIRLHRFIRRVSLLLLSSFLWRVRRRYVVRELHPAGLYYGIGVTGLATGLVQVLAGRHHSGVTGILLGALVLAMGIERDAAESADRQTIVERTDQPAPPPTEDRPIVPPLDAE